MDAAGLSIQVGALELVLQEGDITEIPADAIGNAANAQLAGGTGVDGAIHRTGGPSIMAELNKIRAEIECCPPGSAVHTGAGNLPGKWVLHAVGPYYHDGESGEPEKLRQCYESCIRLADELGARSLTLPAISTGVFGYPMDDAAVVAVSTVEAQSRRSLANLERVTFVLFSPNAYEAFEGAVLEVLG